MGVDFSTKGSSALFLPQNGVMIVRNTQDNLDMVDALVEQANASRPKQVEIESKFVEITQKSDGIRFLRGIHELAQNVVVTQHSDTAGTSAGIESQGQHWKPS